MMGSKMLRWSVEEIERTGRGWEVGGRGCVYCGWRWLSGGVEWGAAKSWVATHGG